LKKSKKIAIAKFSIKTCVEKEKEKRKIWPEF